MSKLSLVTAVAVLVSLSGCDLLKKKEPITISQDGTIQTGDLVLSDDQSLYDDYPVEVGAGWTIHASMSSSAFDTYLHIFDPAGRRVAQHDDIQEGVNTNSDLSYTTTQAGIYHVYANSYKPGEVGAYHVNIVAGPAGSVPAMPPMPAMPAAPAAPAAPAPIAPAQP